MYNLKVYTVAMSILSKCFTVSINRTVQSKYESSKQLSKRTALRVENLDKKLWTPREEGSSIFWNFYIIKKFKKWYKYDLYIC